MLRHFCLSTHTAGGCVPLDSLYLYIKSMAFFTPPGGGMSQSTTKAISYRVDILFYREPAFLGGYLPLPRARDFNLLIST